jgi:hypothetical protein
MNPIQIAKNVRLCPTCLRACEAHANRYDGWGPLTVTNVRWSRGEHTVAIDRRAELVPARGEPSTNVWLDDACLPCTEAFPTPPVSDEGRNRVLRIARSMGRSHRSKPLLWTLNEHVLWVGYGEPVAVATTEEGLIAQVEAGARALLDLYRREREELHGREDELQDALRRGEEQA